MMLLKHEFECYFCKKSFKAFIPDGINIMKGDKVISIPMCDKCKKLSRHLIIRVEDIEKRED